MEDHIGYTLALLVGEEDIKKDELESEIIEEESAIIETLQEEEVQDDILDESGKDPYLKLYSPKLQCHVCYKVMGHRSSLYKHLKYIHKIEPAHRLPISCREKDCTQSFTFIDPFRRHLAEHHGFNIVVEKYLFKNMSEFFGWKKITEQEENLRFIVSTGPRSSKNGKTHYYRCQKNGTYKPEIKKRLQSYDPQSGYNSSRTHCISSMFVFEESDCVTVEFCRTHYGHEVTLEKTLKLETEADSTMANTENSFRTFETVDSISKVNSYLTQADKKALVNIFSKNQKLLDENDDLYYDSDDHGMLKIPKSILELISKEDLRKDSDSSEISTTMEGELTITKVDSSDPKEEEVKIKVENSDSTILKSLGNGVFLDPTSNKRLKLDTLKNRGRKNKPSGATPSQSESKKKEEDKGTMLLREYLNEYNEKIYVLEPMTYEETVVQKREKILAQLQTILMIVNNEEDLDVLDEIKKDLSKYAIAE